MDHLAAIYPVGVTAVQLGQALEDPEWGAVRLAELISADLRVACERREQVVGPVAMKDLVRRVGLTAFDRRWSGYLTQLHDLYRRIPRDSTASGNEFADFRRKTTERFDEAIRLFKEDTISGLFSENDPST